MGPATEPVTPDVRIIPHEPNQTAWILSRTGLGDAGRQRRLLMLNVDGS
jgi:hypothetical protein